MPDKLMGGLNLHFVYISNHFLGVAMEVGQKVRVMRVRDRIPTDVANKIRQNPLGVVSGLRVVDGGGVGLIVTFSDSFSTWFFEDELQAA
jgi:hypothetical protein